MSIASETGWSESYILEELPLARLYSYVHAIYTRYDIPCYFVKRETDMDAYETFERLRNKWVEIDSPE